MNVKDILNPEEFEQMQSFCMEALEKSKEVLRLFGSRYARHDAFHVHAGAVAEPAPHPVQRRGHRENCRVVRSRSAGGHQRRARKNHCESHEGDE